MRSFYYASKEAVANTAANNILSVAGIASVKPMVTKAVISPGAVAAANMTDSTTTWLLTRLTAAVTAGTAVTIVPADAESAAALCTSVHTSTLGTLAASGLHFGLNRRATYTFVANPGEELMPAAGTAGGVVIRSVTAGDAYNVDATLVFQE